MTVSALRRPERIASGLLAILLQAGFMALLILSPSNVAPPRNEARELTFILPRLIEPPPDLPASRAPLFAPVPAVQLPPVASAPSAAPLPQMRALPAAPDFRALGQSLFNCRVDLWSNLTAEQRAHCPRPGEGVAIQQDPNRLGAPAHVKDEAHWRQELANRNDPVQTCMTIQTQKLGFTGQEVEVLMADPTCMAEKLRRQMDK